MPDDDLKRYLRTFTDKAQASGLDMRAPGQNWAPMRDTVPGSHVSLSVRKDQIQVNLNNERDEDRGRFESLYRDRGAIEQAIGEALIWEKKEGRKKTAIRATLERGYEDQGDWDAQHSWAIRLMHAFEKEFGPRLRRVA